MNFKNIKLGETSISSLNDLKPYLKGEFDGRKKEKFMALGFDSNLKITMAENLTEISEKTRAYVDLDKLFKRLKETKSLGLVVSHNHPNGNPVPSEFDINITREIIKLAKKKDLVFMDHILCVQLKDGGMFWWSIKNNLK